MIEMVEDEFYIGRLTNGKKIELSDQEFDVRGLVNQWIECLIYISEAYEKSQEVLKGIFHKNFKLEQSKQDKYLFPDYPNFSRDKHIKSLNNMSTIETDDGTFLISRKEYGEGEEIEINVANYYLQTYYLIE